MDGEGGWSSVVFSFFSMLKFLCNNRTSDYSPLFSRKGGEHLGVLGEGVCEAS
jgi:hypothetical protein